MAGRGLVIVPVYFNYGRPITLIDGELTPTLVCPAVRSETAALAGTAAAGLDELANLIGRSRANILAELDIATSTQTLARRLNLTPGAVSQHTKVLREAGLLTTTRTGQSVRHTLTTLGRTLRGG
nr:helix-turn-helix domain-containing protein [Kribbella solani]